MSSTLLERENELTEIDQALRAGVDGHGGAVLITGAPGAGKTALVEWALVRAGELGLRALVARAGGPSFAREVTEWPETGQPHGCCGCR